MKKQLPRIIIENYYEPCILSLLTKKSSYGYKLKEDLKRQLSCEVQSGNLYRCLQKLHAAGAVTKYQAKSDEGPDRMMYHITAEGIELLHAWISRLHEEQRVLQQLIRMSS